MDTTTTRYTPFPHIKGITPPTYRTLDLYAISECPTCGVRTVRLGDISYSIRETFFILSTPEKVDPGFLDKTISEGRIITIGHGYDWVDRDFLGGLVTALHGKNSRNFVTIWDTTGPASSYTTTHYRWPLFTVQTVPHMCSD